MKDNEMVEKYTEVSVNEYKDSLVDIDDIDILREAIAEAYLTGLKAGRPKWHKVADNDYPPCEKGNCTINVLTDCGDIAYYNYDLECWVAEPASVEIDSPVAWCEIPKYKE